MTKVSLTAAQETYLARINSLDKDVLGIVRAAFRFRNSAGITTLDRKKEALAELIRAVDRVS
jgi:hypothetical protein